MSNLHLNRIQLGGDADANKNFVLMVPSPANGTLEIRRGTYDAPGGLIGKFDANGNLVTNAPAFSAYANAHTALTAGPRAKVIFQVERFDLDGSFSGSRFTAKVHGLFQFQSNVKITGTGLGSVEADIYKNGSLYVCGTLAPPTGSVGRAHVSELVELDVGEHVEIWAFTNAGSSLAFTATNEFDTCTFSGYLVRAL